MYLQILTFSDGLNNFHQVRWYMLLLVEYIIFIHRVEALNISFKKMRCCIIIKNNLIEKKLRLVKLNMNLECT